MSPTAGPLPDTLADVLDDRARPRRVALVAIRALCDQLALAHSQGRPHGALEPRDIALHASGRMLISAWPGPPRPALTGPDRAVSDLSGELPAASPYQAPERALAPAEAPTASADIYSVGGLLYHLLCGRPPIEARDPAELRDAILRRDIPSPAELVELDAEGAALVEVAMRALSHDAERRFESIDALARAIDVAWDASAQATSMATTSARRSPSKSAWLALAALTLICALLASSLRQAQRASLHALRDAQAQADRASEAERRAQRRAAQAERALGRAAENAAALEAARGQANDARGLAERQAERAEQAADRERRARLGAETNLARNLVLQGRVLASSERWRPARESFERARETYARLKQPSLPAELGVWNIERRSPRALLTLAPGPGAAAPLAPLWCLAASPDGRRAVTGHADGRLVLWNLTTGRSLRTRQGAHSRAVLCLDISADGALLVSGGGDGLLATWTLSDLSPKRRVQAHTGPVSAARWQPGRARIASAGYDGYVKLWGAGLEDPGHPPRRHSDKVHALAFNSDGTRLVTCGSDGHLKLWDGRDGALITSFATDGQKELIAVALSTDGRRALTGGYRIATLWALPEGRALRSLLGHRDWVTSVALSRDDTLAATGSLDRSARLWSIEEGREQLSFDEHDSGVRAVAFAGADRKLLTGGVAGGLKLWDAQATEPLLKSPAEPASSSPRCLAISQDGRLLLSAGDGPVVQLWDLATRRELCRYQTGARGFSKVSFTARGRRAIGASIDGRLKVWSLDEGEMVRSLEGHSRSVTGLAIGAKGSRLLSSAGEVLKLWDLERGRQLWSLNHAHAGRITALALSDDGLLAASAAEDGVLRLWRVETGRALASREVGATGFGALRFSADGRRLLCAGADGALELRSAADLNLTRRLLGHGDALVAAEFLGGPELALSASLDGHLKLWQLELGEELWSTEAHSGGVRAIALSRRGAQLVSAGADGLLRCWDFDRPRRRRRLAGELEKARAVLARDPDDGPSLLSLSRWYRFRGLDREAWRCAERALSAGASIRPLEVARVRWLAGELEGARAGFTEALEVSGTDASYLELCLRALESDRR